MPDRQPVRRISGTWRHHLSAAAGRLLLALLFLFSGVGKLSAPGATLAYIESAKLPLPVVGLAIALLLEIGAGLMLLAGFQTRAAAAILAVYSVATALFFHNQFGDQNQLIHFLKNIAICGGLLQVVAFGAGAISLDARRIERRVG